MSGMMTRIGACAALLAALLGGWTCGASGRRELADGLQAATFYNHLLEARASLLGARVSLYEGEFGEMNRRLEEARRLVGRAHLDALALDGGLEAPELERISAEINEAQRLAARLRAGAGRCGSADGRVVAPRAVLSARSSRRDR